MPATFNFRGIDPRGQKRRGKVVAIDRAAALMRLHRRGIDVTRLRRHWFHEAILRDFEFLRRRLPLDELAWMFRNLANLLRSGLTVVAACELLADQRPRSRTGHLLASIQADLEDGVGVGDAFSSRRRDLGPVAVSMVVAGEASSTLQTTFLSIATLCQTQARMRRTVRRSVSYPITMLMTTGGLLAGMLYFIVPQFQKSYDEMGTELPYLTRLVVNASVTLSRQGWAIPIAVSVLILLTIGIRQLPVGRLATDHLLLRTPRIGPVVRRSVTARGAKTLGTLVASRVPLIDALALAGAASGNAVIQQGFDDVADAVAVGDSVAVAFAGAQQLPLELRDLAVVGEASGDLGGTMVRWVDAIEADLSTDGDGIGKSLEPVMLVTIGTLMGLVVIALYLPMFDMAKSIK